jgi:hypothetical protein
MAQFILCPRSNNRITDTECSDYICRLTDPAGIALCQSCDHGRLIAATAEFPRKPKPERIDDMAKDKVQTPNQTPAKPKANGKSRHMDRISIRVPPEIKARLKAFSKGEMGNMSAQGRYYLLRALDMAEDRAERSRDRV